MLDFNAGKRTILVVEDNEINREMLSALLEDEFNVLEAENGLVGLERLEENYQDITLVLLDVMMPVCDGFEFLERKREDSRFDSIPVIVATASGSLKDEIRCLELGANDFVVKPYNFEVMMNRISNTVHLRESASLVNLLTWDKLTGFYTKEVFYHNVEDLLKSVPDQRYDLMCSDIQNFKSLNDRYGPKVCDQLLEELAGRLREAVPGLVAAGRVSGDTFAFLFEHQERGWERVLDPVMVDLPVPSPGVKFGIVEDVDHELSPSALCDRAIMALESATGSLGAIVAFYDDDLRQRQIVEQIIVESMEAALAEHQYQVWFQPKHSLSAGRTGGAEALARWIHPELGFVSPAVFIPIFERNGFITKLDMYIWEEACKLIKASAERGLQSVPVSVNASRLDFDVPDLADRIADLADRYGIDRSMLHVEVTETAYSDNPDQVVRALEDLRAHGFSIELDDFGSGFSSLSSLNTLPLDIMKLDMSLIRQATELNDFRIVKSTIELAHTLGLKTVVEGVEHAEEVEKLDEMNCDYIQGYYYSKPLKPDEFEEYLAG